MIVFRNGVMLYRPSFPVPVVNRFPCTLRVLSVLHSTSAGILVIVFSFLPDLAEETSDSTQSVVESLLHRPRLPAASARVYAVFSAPRTTILCSYSVTRLFSFLFFLDQQPPAGTEGWEERSIQGPEDNNKWSIFKR